MFSNVFIIALIIGDPDGCGGGGGGGERSSSARLDGNMGNLILIEVIA